MALYWGQWLPLPRCKHSISTHSLNTWWRTTCRTIEWLDAMCRLEPRGTRTRRWISNLDWSNHLLSCLWDIGAWVLLLILLRNTLYRGIAGNKHWCVHIQWSISHATRGAPRRYNKYRTTPCIKWRFNIELKFYTFAGLIFCLKVQNQV